MAVRTCNKCGCEKALEDFPVQRNCKDGRRPTCKVCMAAKTAAWRAADPTRAKQSQAAVKERDKERWYEKQRARTRKYKSTNREKVKEAANEYNNRDYVKARKAEKYKANAESVKQRSAEWARNNQDRVRELSLVSANKRRALKLQALPKWANAVEIKKVYERSSRISRMTGVPHDVDHIVPLQGKNVCGLHVEYNLRIVEASINRSKGNKHEG